MWGQAEEEEAIGTAGAPKAGVKVVGKALTEGQARQGMKELEEDLEGMASLKTAGGGLDEGLPIIKKKHESMTVQVNKS
jgi:hypothetical protein